VQQYWINNATSGAFTLNVKTSAGTPTQVNQGAKGIYYCDGSSIILASDPTSFTLPVTVADGGTGATTASAARLNLGITLFADPIVTATTGASVRTTIGAAAAGANSDITSLSGLTTPLSVLQGGTGVTTSTGSSSNVLSNAPTLTSPVITTASLTNPTVTNYIETLYAPAAGSSFTVALSDGTVQRFTTNANTTVTLPASVAGKSFVVMIQYGGAHTLTWAGGSTLKWNANVTPTPTSVNGKIDIFSFFQDGTNTYGSTFGQNF
jgi:hypothetical protein